MMDELTLLVPPCGAAVEVKPPKVQ